MLEFNCSQKRGKSLVLQTERHFVLHLPSNFNIINLNVLSCPALCDLSPPWSGRPNDEIAKAPTHHTLTSQHTQTKPFAHQPQIPFNLLTLKMI